MVDGRLSTLGGGNLRGTRASHPVEPRPHHPKGANRQGWQGRGPLSAGPRGDASGEARRARVPGVRARHCASGSE
eukprot:2474025-Alexandrium_andersonii.AAC.1